MEEKIKFYCDKSKRFDDPVERARYVLDMLLGEYDHIRNPCVVDQFDRSLDEALEHFYVKKEIRFVQLLLEHYIANGNYALSEKNDTFHRLDRFQYLKQLLCSLMPPFIPASQSEV